MDIIVKQLFTWYSISFPCHSILFDALCAMLGVVAPTIRTIGFLSFTMSTHPESNMESRACVQVFRHQQIGALRHVEALTTPRPQHREVILSTVWTVCEPASHPFSKVAFKLLRWCRIDTQNIPRTRQACDRIAMWSGHHLDDCLQTDTLQVGCACRCSGFSSSLWEMGGGLQYCCTPRTPNSIRSASIASGNGHEHWC